MEATRMHFIISNEINIINMTVYISLSRIKYEDGIK